jgi:arylsulfatase A-like enzyme
MLLLALALTPLQLASVPSAAAEPNILLIVSDDHGFADLGQAGSLIDTPTLDSLAAAGVVLDRYHTYPICGPTRVGLMTGRNPARLGLTSNISNGEDGVPLDERFLPEIFQDAGYQTWMMGKWHLGGSTGDAYLPQNRGFDHFYGFLGGSIDETEHTSGGSLDWQRNGTDVSEDAGQRATDLLTDEAIALIANRDMSRPFFLYLSFHAVHTPYDAPAELKAKYAALGLTGRDLGYAAMLENMDQNIGRVLDTLEADGIAAETLVVFSSDNGAGEDLGGSNSPLRGWKADVWEGGHRVPAILRWPGVFPAATTSTQFVSHLDWLPTLAAAAGLPTGVTAKLDGVDRLEALTTGAAGRPRGHVVQRAAKVAVLDGDWKLVRETAVGDFQLFDVYSDPAETADVAGANAAVTATLATYIDLIVTCGDGIVDAGEECDGGPAGAECCDDFCQLLDNGSACSDQEVCTRTDSCLEGECIPGACAVGLNCTICGGTCADTAGCHCEF